MKVTRTDRKILAALDSDGDMSPRDVADALGFDCYKWIGRKLRGLLDSELVRVSRWIRNTDGHPIPVYSVTPGDSAKRIKAQGYSVWSKRYRKKLSENGGEQYLKARSSLALLVNITSRKQL